MRGRCEGVDAHLAPLRERASLRARHTRSAPRVLLSRQQQRPPEHLPNLGLFAGSSTFLTFGYLQALAAARPTCKGHRRRRLLYRAGRARLRRARPSRTRRPVGAASAHVTHRACHTPRSLAPPFPFSSPWLPFGRRADAPAPAAVSVALSAELRDHGMASDTHTPSATMLHTMLHTSGTMLHTPGTGIVALTSRALRSQARAR